MKLFISISALTVASLMLFGHWSCAAADISNPQITQIAILTAFIFTFKIVSWGLLGILGLYAAIGVALFGVDARKLYADLNELRDKKGALDESIKLAQQSMDEATSSAQEKMTTMISDALYAAGKRREELNTLISNTREQTEKRISELTHFLDEASTQRESLTRHFKDLEEEYEELGAIVQELSERAHAPTTPLQTSDGAAKRSNIALIGEVIASGHYEWTTIGRIEELTGLTEQTIMDEVRTAPDIRIGEAKKQKDRSSNLSDRISRSVRGRNGWPLSSKA